MPEGDTIYRSARVLHRALAGREVQTVEAADWPSRAQKLSPSQILQVVARGKHLAIHFREPFVVHSHMGMTGSWHLYRVGEPWRKPVHRGRCVLRCAEIVAVCFTPKQLEILTRIEYDRHPFVRGLGADILADDFRAETVVASHGAAGRLPVGEWIMDQRLLCGIGNVYKSESLFLCRCNPFLPAGELPEGLLLALIERNRSLMRRNLEGYPRRTRNGFYEPRLWVYGREREPCHVCGTTIRMRRQGTLGRSTYYCPKCQNVAREPETTD